MVNEQVKEMIFLRITHNCLNYNIWHIIMRITSHFVKSKRKFVLFHQSEYLSCLPLQLISPLFKSYAKVVRFKNFKKHIF